MTPSDLFPINPKLSLLPPRSLVRLGEFPDLVKLMEDVAKERCPGRPIIRLFIKLCRLSTVASVVWFFCLASACSSIICGLVAFLASRRALNLESSCGQLSAAASVAVFLVCHAVYASIRKYAADLADDVKEAQEHERQLRSGTPLRILVP